MNSSLVLKFFACIFLNYGTSLFVTGLVFCVLLGCCLVVTCYASTTVITATNDRFHTGVIGDYSDDKSGGHGCSTPPQFNRGRHRQSPTSVVSRHDNVLDKCSTPYTRPHF